MISCWTSESFYWMYRCTVAPHNFWLILRMNCDPDPIWAGSGALAGAEDSCRLQPEIHCPSMTIEIHTVLDSWDAAKTTEARVQQMTSRFHGSTIFVIRVHVVHGFCFETFWNDIQTTRMENAALAVWYNGIIGRLAVCTITTLHVAHSEGQVSNLPRSFWHNW